MGRDAVGRRSKGALEQESVTSGRRGVESHPSSPDSRSEETHNGGRPNRRDARQTELLAFLRDDHEDVLSQYEGFQTAGGDDRYFLANRILRKLELHYRVEEAVLYEAVGEAAERQRHRKASATAKALRHEHQAVKEHIRRVKESRAYDDRLTAQVDALMERVRCHAEREERELFPLADALLGQEALTRLRQDARQWQEEIEQQLAA